MAPTSPGSVRCVEFPLLNLRRKGNFMPSGEVGISSLDSSELAISDRTSQTSQRFPSNHHSCCILLTMTAAHCIVIRDPELVIGGPPVQIKSERAWSPEFVLTLLLPKNGRFVL
eukprot:3781357-Rhodomonas_salina.2